MALDNLREEHKPFLNSQGLTDVTGYDLKIELCTLSPDLSVLRSGIPQTPQ
jgi:hypothetical protein